MSEGPSGIWGGWLTAHQARCLAWSAVFTRGTSPETQGDASHGKPAAAKRAIRSLFHHRARRKLGANAPARGCLPGRENRRCCFSKSEVEDRRFPVRFAVAPDPCRIRDSPSCWDTRASR